MTTNSSKHPLLFWIVVFVLSFKCSQDVLPCTIVIHIWYNDISSKYDRINFALFHERLGLPSLTPSVYFAVDTLENNKFWNIQMNVKTIIFIDWDATAHNEPASFKIANQKRNVEIKPSTS